MNHTAPIALFVYKRPELTKRTLDALKQNEGASASDLHVFSDGWNNDRDRKAVESVRDLLGGLTGFRSVSIVAREENLGLSRSIVSGVTSVLRENDRIIVLEDDLVTSPYFLRYMNDGLHLYAADSEVVSVHGYVYPVSVPLPETFFLRGADCWGWGTWKRGWETLNLDANALLSALEESGQSREFDFDGSYPYTRMLRRQSRGKIDSWAVCWYASAFLGNKLTLYPGRSLVHHSGTGDGATHAWSLSALYDTAPSPTTIKVERIPVEEHSGARQAFTEFFRTARGSLPSRAWKRLRQTLRLAKV
ncbi:MAG: glycosyltransferase [Ignavibacterium sp.]|jgi:hypothetical protein